MKEAGAVLLLLACYLFGFGWTGSMKRRITFLETACGVIRRTETELRQQGKPLAEIAEQEGYSALSAELRRGTLFTQAACPLLEKAKRQLGDGEALAALEELAWNLGRYDSETQAAVCSRVCERLEVCKGQLERELSEKKRLYRTVPLALGSMVLLAAM